MRADFFDKGANYGFQGTSNAKIPEKIVFHFYNGDNMFHRGGYSSQAFPGATHAGKRSYEMNRKFVNTS